MRTFAKWLTEEGIGYAQAPNAPSYDPAFGPDRPLMRSHPDSHGDIQQFEKLMDAEIKTWEAHEIQLLIQAVTKHGQAAGFLPQEIQKMVQGVQYWARTEGVEAAVHFATKAPDILLHHNVG